MKEQVEAIIIEVLKEIAEDAQLPGLQSPDGQTRLYGRKSPLDSMALVSMVAELETRIADAFGVEIIIADENTFDARLSPLARVATLTEHICMLIEQN